MAWITTDTDVATTLTVNKTVEGQSAPGYPKVYSILDAFGAFPAITENEWHKMLKADRTPRITAFKSYVGNLEALVVDDTQTNEVYRPSTETPGTVVEI